MKNLALLPYLLCIATALPAQEKGVTPIAPYEFPASYSTRAVVVGISDYQSPQIPDLQFAHRDAEAFAAWLQSPAGGGLPPANITLLTNEKATNAAIITALFALLDICQPGDKAIFYFSGHGDVESKTRNQPGFLLAYDTPPTVYMAGAVNLRDLQEIVSTLADKQVKMVLVTDACHAGKLAGNAINGTQATALTLSRQFANEVKIMSCQPNEFSLEGAQWGGGRGVFSYHLLDALTGMADIDADGGVNLFETGRYLEDRVPAETAPHPQMPLVTGDRQFLLARVDAATLAALKKSRSSTALTTLQPTDNKGLEDELLAAADSATRQRYQNFKQALADGRLLDPPDSCAEALLTLLLRNEALKPLHGLLRRNLAVALLDEVQQTLNALLDDDPYEVNNWIYHPDKYQNYPRYIEQAITLLGDNHYLRNTLRAKKLYFEAYPISQGRSQGSDEWHRFGSRKAAARLLLDEAIQLDSEAAYLYHSMAMLYKWNSPYATDSVEKYCQLAISLSPHWLLPYLDAGQEHTNTTMNMERAEYWLLLAYQQKPNSYLVLERLGKFRAYVQGRLDEAISLTQKMIDQKPDLFNGYMRMGITLYLKKDFQNAIRFLQKGLELDTARNNGAFEYLSSIYQETRHGKKGESIWYKTYQDTSLSNFWIGHIYADLERYDLAENFLIRTQDSILWSAPIVVKTGVSAINCFLRHDIQKAQQELLHALTLDPTPNAYFALIYTWLAEIEAAKNNDDASETWFKKAVAYQSGLFIEDLPCRDIAHFHYGQFLLRRGRQAEAADMFRWCNDWTHQNGFRGYYGFALLAAQQGHSHLALDYLEKALDHWYPEPGPIRHEPLFQNIRKTKRFGALMQKHFPPGWEER